MAQALKDTPSSPSRRPRRNAPPREAMTRWQAFSRTATAGTPADQISLIRQGTNSDVVRGAAEAVGVPVDSLWRLCGRNAAGARLRSSGRPVRLDSGMTERLFRFARIVDEAIATFGDQNSAAAWLLDPNLALGGDSPLSMLDTQTGSDEVRRILVSIRYGGVC